MITFPYCWVLHVFLGGFFCFPKRLVAHEYLSFICFLSISTSTHLSFYSAFLLSLFYFSYFLIFLHAINRALRCWFLSGNVLCLNMVSSYLELGSASIICPDTPHMKKKEKKRKAYGEKSASLVTWAECSPCFQMYLNVFGLIGLQIGWNRMFSLAFIHSCNFRGTLSYISLFFIHLGSVTGFVLRNSTWVQSKLWLICTKSEDVIVIRARQGSLMRPAVGEGKTWKAKVSTKITRIYYSQPFDWRNKIFILANFDKVL